MKVTLKSLLSAFLVAGCTTAPPMPAPTPAVTAVEAPRIVQEKCKDQRPAAPDYPDTDKRLAAISDGDFEALSKAFRAGRDRRDTRLVIDDVQIKGCTGAQ